MHFHNGTKSELRTVVRLLPWSIVLPWSSWICAGSVLLHFLQGFSFSTFVAAHPPASNGFREMAIQIRQQRMPWPKRDSPTFLFVVGVVEVGTRRKWTVSKCNGGSSCGTRILHDTEPNDELQVPFGWTMPIRNYTLPSQSGRRRWRPVHCKACECCHNHLYRGGGAWRGQELLCPFLLHWRRAEADFGEQELAMSLGRAAPRGGCADGPYQFGRAQNQVGDLWRDWAHHGVPPRSHRWQVEKEGIRSQESPR